MSVDFRIGQDDTLPIFDTTLKDGEGNRVSLAGATVLFKMWEPGEPLKVNGNCTVSNTHAGRVTYAWQTGDTDTPGLYRGQFFVTFSDLTVQKFPTAVPLRILVERKAPDPET